MAVKNSPAQAGTNKKKSKKDTAVKVNKVLRYVAIILVIVFTSFSLISLTLRERLLSPGLYTSAVEHSGIYELTTEVIEDTATEALLALEREVIIGLGIFQEPEEQTILESTLVLVISSVLEDATETFVSNLSQKIDLEGILKNATEQLIVNDTAWLAGNAPDPEIFKRIPEPEEIERIQNTQLTDIARGFTIELFGLGNLPACANQSDVELNVARIKDGNITKVTCTNDEISVLINASVDEFLPGEVIGEAEANAKGELDRLGISPIIEGVLNFSLLVSNLKQFALDLRAFFASMQETAVFMFIMSIPLLAYALIVTKKQRFRTILKVYFGTGLVIMTFGVLQYLALSNALVNFTSDGLGAITESFLSSTQQVVFAQAIRSIKLAVIRDLSISVFLVGMVITILFGTPFTIFKILDRTSKPKPLKSK